MAKLRLSTWLSDPAKQAISLDLTGHAIRFLRLRRRGRNAEVVRYGSFPLPAGTVQHGGVANANALQQQISSLVDSKLVGKPKPQAAVIAISEHHAFLKFLELPSGSPADFNEAVRWEVTQHIPYELKDLNLDWVSPSVDHQAPPGALVVAAPRELVESYAQTLELAKVTPLAIESSSLSVSRMFVNQLPVRASSLLLTIGELESSVTLVQAKVPMFTAMVRLTADELTAQAAAQYKLSVDEAQRALFAFGLYKSRARGVIRELIRDRVNELASRLQEVADFYHDHFSNPADVTSILICGPGAQIAGLADELGSRLKLEVLAANLPTGIRVSKAANQFTTRLLEYSIALGAGLRLIDGRSGHG
ncbi:MAG: type IV pilus assembly protein PilM [Candidatus Kerfeldbacteria bacterium]|nr:type IV pilus assembly protein PilM [Candidatus Kerfeldbacteria bacterium]